MSRCSPALQAPWHAAALGASAGVGEGTQAPSKPRPCSQHLCRRLWALQLTRRRLSTDLSKCFEWRVWLAAIGTQHLLAAAVREQAAGCMWFKPTALDWWVDAGTMICGNTMLIFSPARTPNRTLCCLSARARSTGSGWWSRPVTGSRRATANCHTAPVCCRLHGHANHHPRLPRTRAARPTPLLLLSLIAWRAQDELIQEVRPPFHVLRSPHPPLLSEASLHSY